MPLKGLDFSKARVLVVGDVMLDEYWDGTTARISPEAPVPIVHVQQMHERPGGAANVALGIATLGAQPYLIGVVGEDAAARTLKNLLASQSQPIPAYLHPIEMAHTIKKLRVLSRDQQIVRLDMEKPFVLNEEHRIQLREHYLQALENTDLVVLSDYGKGTLFEAVAWIHEARVRGIPIIVDPKSLHFSDYKGASILTPNMKEFEAVAGRCETVDLMVERAMRLLSEHEIDAMVITRSEQGLSIISKNEAPIHIQTMVREVHDVTGAGDTVVAVLSAALASGMGLVESATLGNVGAGVVVGKLGAATVSISELEHALSRDQQLPLGVMSEEELIKVLKLSRMKNERIVFTNGCFDILHAGHVMYLEQAKALGDRLIVGVNTDVSVSKLKGPTRPINALIDRMSVLAGLRSVDWVVPFSEDTPERLIKALSPHVLAKGGDYQHPHLLAGATHVLSQGGEVRILDLKEGCSTTQTIEKITIIS